jgi:multiple sugar transport system ATP-binding protein
MAQVELRNLGKVFEGHVQAVDSANITVKDHEFVVFVGPSGCGKTTILRMIAGLEDATSGDILIDDERMNDVAPKDRNIAMVFQNYALYPHMTVYENMAFGLRIRKTEKAEIDRRVREAARILDIEELLKRKPKALSGGQRQRVAVGRAIVRKPKVFLFDEPLSNLDAKLRVQMRAEISKLHHQLNATMIYVTHDQVEAMTMGDQIVVMMESRIQQIGSPLYIYNHPFNRFVAGFIGSPPMNVLAGRLVQEVGHYWVEGDGFRIQVAPEHQAHLKDWAGKAIDWGIRPEDLAFQKQPRSGFTIPAKVAVIEPLGAEVHLQTDTANGPLVARVSPHDRYWIGQEIHFAPRMDMAHFFDRETGVSLLPVKRNEQAPYTNVPSMVE